MASKKTELFLNEIAADLSVLTVTLQTMLLTMLSKTPHAQGMLEELNDQVMTFLESVPGSIGPDGRDKMKALTAMRAELFFQQLRSALGLSEATGAPPGSN